MNASRYYLLLFCFLTSLVCKSQPSKDSLVTAEFNGERIEQFVRILEQQTKYRFYYNPVEFDSFVVTLGVKAMPVHEVLKLAFRHTDFWANFDNENHVFLTKGLLILTALPKPGVPVATGTIKDRQLAKSSDRISLNQSFANERLYELGQKSQQEKGNTAAVTLFVVSAKTKEPITDGTINIDGKSQIAIINSNAVYEIMVPKGRHVLTVNSFGKKQAVRRLMVYGDGTLTVEMEEKIALLEDVLVSTQRNAGISRATMGVERLTIKSIKKIPVVFGEADVLRAILTLPGVKSVGEASTGFNVRGGGTDQNLILFNDANIYNPSHFFGFFSSFNPEIIKEVELLKSSIPAKYGGRLSSVLNITGREGNKSKYTGTAGIGLLTSRINLEGPIIKEKASFNFGARTTYANWLLKLLPETYKNSAASFYDINLLISHKINKKNDLSITGYVSGDKFRLNNDTTFGYQNKSVSIKWKHAFSDKLEAVFLTGYDRYSYNNTSEENVVNAYKMSFDISQINLKSDFTYTANAKHNLDFGISSIFYKLHPGSFVPVGSASLVSPVVIAPEQALESGVYLGDRYDVNKKLSLSSGVRYSIFNYIGPQITNIYAEGLPRDEGNLIHVSEKGPGNVIKTYHGPEFRFSAKYSITTNTSVKAGYTTLRQYIHMLSNTTAISPTDIWKLSDYNINPQFGDQVAFGLFRNFRNDSIETSVELYYKRLENILDYKSGAQLVLNPHIERDVMNTRGKAYGLEFMIKKKSGRLNGWFGYTFSRTLLKMDDERVGPVINKGRFYPANYDKPHDGTLVGNYILNYRFSVSLNVTYSTGRPITLPIGTYIYSGSERALYSDRNAYRIPNYFRADISMNIEGNHKIRKLTHNSFTIGVYNLTGRKNPYSVYYTSENGVINGYKLSVFGSAIPFINYNIRF